MTCRSEEYSAAAGGKRLITQPLSGENFAAKGGKALITQHRFNIKFNS
jgi:hypothetical protein